MANKFRKCKQVYIGQHFQTTIFFSHLMYSSTFDIALNYLEVSLLLLSLNERKRLVD